MINQTPHLHPAQIGDICLLIEPDPHADITLLRERQAMLHRRLGSKSIPHVHLTCQGFCCDEDIRLAACIDVVISQIRGPGDFAILANLAQRDLILQQTQQNCG